MVDELGERETGLSRSHRGKKREGTMRTATDFGEKWPWPKFGSGEESRIRGGSMGERGGAHVRMERSSTRVHFMGAMGAAWVGERWLGGFKASSHRLQWRARELCCAGGIMARPCRRAGEVCPGSCVIERERCTVELQAIGEGDVAKQVVAVRRDLVWWRRCAAADVLNDVVVVSGAWGNDSSRGRLGLSQC